VSIDCSAYETLDRSTCAEDAMEFEINFEEVSAVGNDESIADQVESRDPPRDSYVCLGFGVGICQSARLYLLPLRKPIARCPLIVRIYCKCCKTNAMTRIDEDLSSEPLFRL
jgi:hypothetical protein